MVVDYTLVSSGWSVNISLAKSEGESYVLVLIICRSSTSGLFRRWCLTGNRFLPYVGYITIAMVSISHALRQLPSRGAPLTVQNDFPQLKYALLGVVGLFLLLQKEHS